MYVKYLNFAISGLAILTMFICVIRGVLFHRRIQGGRIKRRVAVLVGLLVFFFVGYIVSPFLYLIEEFEYTTLIVYLVFLFGALFVLISLDTMNAVLKFFGIIDQEKK